MTCPTCKNEVKMPIAYCGTGFVPADQAQQCTLCGSIFPLFFWNQTAEANKDLTSCEAELNVTGSVASLEVEW